MPYLYFFDILFNLIYELIVNALNDNAITLFLLISYDIYVAFVSLVACLGPCNIDFHNETLICFSSSHPEPMQTEKITCQLQYKVNIFTKNLIKL